MKRIVLTPNPKYIKHLIEQKVMFSQSKESERWSSVEYTPKTITIEKYPKGYKKFDGVIGVNEFFKGAKNV